MKKQKEKSADNTPLLVLIGVLGVGTTLGAVAWSRSRTSASSPAGSSRSGTTPSSSLPQIATAIRQSTLITDGCSVSWRVGEASRTELLAHQSDFFIPAIADARAKGAVTVDEITAHVTSLLVPGCAWPPTVLQDLNLDDAVNNKLSFTQTQMWTIAQSIGSVRLYLTVRQVVASLAAQDRRG